MISGFARDARSGLGLADAQITVQWMELVWAPECICTRRIPRGGTTTAPNGWFAICDVPAKGSVMLSADRGADSTDIIEVQVPDNGVLRRDLFLGAMRTQVLAIPARDSMPRSERRMHLGDGRLTGPSWPRSMADRSPGRRWASSTAREPGPTISANGRSARLRLARACSRSAPSDTTPPASRSTLSMAGRPCAWRFPR